MHIELSPCSGRPHHFTYNGTVYFYVLNIFGDVCVILDANGNICGSYLYDAYGNTVSTSGSAVGLNPVRYRGYFYDGESGLYYCGSRYYDPELGRFISPDVVYDTDAGLQGYNLFAYCGNNPVNRIDISGTDSEIVPDIDCTDDELDKKESGQPRGNRRSFPRSGNNSRSHSSNGSTPKGNDASEVKQPGRGMQNPKTRQAAQKGQVEHKNANYGPGTVKEAPLGKGNRVDGLDLNNRIIYELKPNNPRAIVRGQMQLIRYTSAVAQIYGGTWTGILVTYD